MLTYTGPKCIMTAEGTHDPSKTYEALDVVYDSVSGNSYVAKIDVPAGVPLSNTTYWNISANPNQAVSVLQADVATLKSDMGQAKTDIQGKIDTTNILATKQDVENNLDAGKLVDAQLLKNVVKMEVEDNLTSTSTKNALSANQGNVLNTAVASKVNKSNVKTTYADVMNSVDDNDIVAAKALKEFKTSQFYYIDIPFSVTLENVGEIKYVVIPYEKPAGYKFLDVVITNYSIPHVAMPCVTVVTDTDISITVYNGFGRMETSGTVRVILIKE